MTDGHQTQIVFLTRGARIGFTVAGIALAICIGFLVKNIVDLNGERSVRIQENAAAVALALRSLCDQKQSYIDQLDSTKTYLRMHPNGIPSIGFTRALLLNQEKTLRLRLVAYSGIHCTKGATQP